VTITVETGAGLSDAVSYISAADAATYFAARGVDTWAESDAAEQEAALVRATSSLDSWLRGRWLGTKKTQTQALAWPRISAMGATTGVEDEEGYELSTTAVPVQVKQATCEIALIELTERFIQQSVSKDNTIASESVGPISVSYRGDAPTTKTYPHVEALLRGLASIGGTQIGFTIGLTDEEQEYLDNQGEFDIFDYSAYFNTVKNY